MRAARLTEINQPLSIEDLPAPIPSDEMAIVSVRAAALNRRDFWMQKGMYPGIRLPVTPGSDGAGTLDGKDVLIDPGLEWGTSEKVQSPDFRILGMPEDGTLAEHVAVPKVNVYTKPGHLSWEEAAALPLAGVTAYRALFGHGMAEPGQKVLITGVGGGVALTTMQLALAHGLQVGVTSGQDEKLEKARALGAHYSANYRHEGWEKSLLEDHGEFDIVIDSAGGEGFSRMLRLVRPGGRIVIYGGTTGKIQDLSPQILFWRQITIQGSTMGSPADFKAMLEFVTKHKIRPVIDSVFPLAEINNALARLKESNQFGKVVITIS